MANAEGISQKALVDVRQSVSSLRVSESKSLPEEIENTLRICQAAGIETDFRLEGQPRAVSAQVSLASKQALPAQVEDEEVQPAEESQKSGSRSRGRRKRR